MPYVASPPLFHCEDISSLAASRVVFDWWCYFLEHHTDAHNHAQRHTPSNWNLSCVLEGLFCSGDPNVCGQTELVILLQCILLFQKYSKETDFSSFSVWYAFQNYRGNISLFCVIWPRHLAFVHFVKHKTWKHLEKPHSSVEQFVICCRSACTVHTYTTYNGWAAMCLCDLRFSNNKSLNSNLCD